MRTAGSGLSWLLNALVDSNQINLINCVHRPYVKCREYCESVIKGSWENGTRITTTRHPYENTISLFMRSNPNTGSLHELINTDSPALLEKTAQQFRDSIKNKDSKVFAGMNRQGKILFDPTGKVDYNYVIRFETLDRDIISMLDDLNILKVIDETKRFKNFIKTFENTKSIDIDKWYDTETKDIVYNTRKMEFEEFKYKR